MTDTPKPASVAETLKAARAVLEDPSHWTRWALAQDAHGWPVSAQSPAAQQWCMLGALRRVDGPCEQAAIETLRDMLPRRYDREIAEYNDSDRRRHSEVLATFDKAIARAVRAEQQS